MAQGQRNGKDSNEKQNSNSITDYSRMYLARYLALKEAIVKNCEDCIRDCGNDCLDSQGKPVENLKCPLQKVRIDFGITVENNKRNPHDDRPDFNRDDEDDFLGLDFGDKKEVGLV
jgi:hypothetical protein